MICILNTKSEIIFDEDLTIKSTAAIDLSHLRHGVRIRYDGVVANQSGAVQFISKDPSGAAQYFVEFLGCEALADGRVQGRNLLTALGAIAADLDLELEEIRMRAHSYWMDCRKRKEDMSLRGLANAILPNDHQTVLDLLGNEEHRLPGTFPPPPQSIMRDLVKFSFSGDDLKLEINRRWFEHLDALNGSLIIRNAPPALIARIQQEKADIENPDDA